ncbi:MAG: non-ribosomal peptide synthetase [Actinomycetia bacterium]|nr:non-ribosomal peptide synthetase [Actinomycetes bacterium]
MQVAGRTDQQIKIDGYRVELTEIEIVLAAAGGVSAAAAVPLDGGISRTLGAVVTPAAVDVDEVWAQAAERLPRYMMPSTLVAAAALPLSTAGKADRRAIEALLRQHASAASADDPLDYVTTMVARWLGGPVDADGLSLLDLGVGSLSAARLAAEIACRYQVRLQLSEVIGARSLCHLADLVRDRAPQCARGWESPGALGERA